MTQNADGLQPSALPALHPRARIGIGFKTSPQAVGWQTLDDIWAAAGELEVFSSAWMNDHLMSPLLDHGGSSFEAVTAMAALAHRVPGKWLGHSVLSNTFRTPAMTTKIATTFDHVTGGRFILGLGAGWHASEHESFGIDLPPIGERMSRMSSAVRVLKALFGDAATGPNGADLDDQFYPLRSATNEPPPVQDGGPPIWLGGQKARGIRMAGQMADGWFFPVPMHPDAMSHFDRRLDLLWRELDAAARDRRAFAVAVHVRAGNRAHERREGLAMAREMVSKGATHVIISCTPANGVRELRAAAKDIAGPLLSMAP